MNLAETKVAWEAKQDDEVWPGWWLTETYRKKEVARAG